MNARYVSIVNFASLLPTRGVERKRLIVIASDQDTARDRIVKHMQGICPTGAWSYEVEPTRLGR